MSMDDGAVTYADHDVQHIRHGVRWQSDADSGPSDGYGNVKQFEITERGLEPDEIAELRAMRVTLSSAQLTTVNQGLPGTVQGLVDAGYNLSGSEFLLGDSNTQNVDTDDSGTTDFVVRSRDTDEVGQIYTNRITETLSFGSNSNSVGGGGQGSTVVETVNMADLFGSGPFVDSADDFVSRIFLDVNDSLETVEVAVTYSLYYNVMETEGGRSRFGR